MLVTCKECGDKISDTSRRCPHCGAPKREAVGVRKSQLIVLRFVCGIFFALGIYFIRTRSIYADLGSYMMLFTFGIFIATFLYKKR